MKAVPAIIALTLLISVPAFACKVIEPDLSELVAEADHIIVGKVVDVDMIDKDGNAITDENKRADRDGNDTIRFYVKVARHGVLRTTGDQNVEELIVPLRCAWPTKVAGWKKGVKGETFIFLLKGEDYQRITGGNFMRKTSERRGIEKLLAQPEPEDQPDESESKPADMTTQLKGSIDSED